MKTIEEQGYHLAKGGIKYLLEVSLLLLALGIGATLLANLFSIGLNSSDYSGWNRSGLRIYTDHKTGVQYIGNSKGLCVRIDADGKPFIEELD